MNIRKNLMIPALTALLLSTGCSAASKEETVYSADMKSGDPAVAEVVSFAPVFGIYNDDGSVQINKEYTELVTECYTTEGELFYAVISVDDYLKNIDPDLDLSNSIVLSTMGNVSTIYCSPARKIHGQIKDSSSVSEGLEENAGKTVLVCSSIEEQGTPDASAAQLYTDAAKGGDYAYIDVVGIQPYYTLSNNSMGGYSGFICYTEDEMGTTYWVHVSLDKYREFIDANVQSSPYAVDGGLEAKTFDKVTRIYGGVTFADSYSLGLSDEIGVKVLNFDKME